MSNFNNQIQCVVCGEEQKENSIGLWIDVSDLWKLEKNTIRACCSWCESKAKLLSKVRPQPTYPFYYQIQKS